MRDDLGLWALDMTGYPCWKGWYPRECSVMTSHHGRVVINHQERSFEYRHCRHPTFWYKCSFLVRYNFKPMWAWFQINANDHKLSTGKHHPLALRQPPVAAPAVGVDAVHVSGCDRWTMTSPPDQSLQAAAKSPVDYAPPNSAPTALPGRWNLACRDVWKLLEWNQWKVIKFIHVSYIFLLYA